MNQEIKPSVRIKQLFDNIPKELTDGRVGKLANWIVAIMDYLDEQHAKKIEEFNCDCCGMDLNNFRLCPNCTPGKTQSELEEYCIKKYGKDIKHLCSDKPSPSSDPSKEIGEKECKKHKSSYEYSEHGSECPYCDKYPCVCKCSCKPPLAGHVEDEVDLLQGIKNNLYNRSKRVDFFGCHIIPEEDFESIAEAIHRFVSKRKPELVEINPIELLHFVRNNKNASELVLCKMICEKFGTRPLPSVEEIEKVLASVDYKLLHEEGYKNSGYSSLACSRRAQAIRSLMEERQ